MRNFVMRQNVERFRRMLSKEADPTKRDVLAQLLAAEEARLGHDDEGSSEDMPATKPS